MRKDFLNILSDTKGSPKQNSDFSHIRRKNRRKVKNKLKNPDSDLPFKESLGDQYKDGCLHDWRGSFTSKPIHRFIKSRVGKKWDDVYSEFCENLKKNHYGSVFAREQIDSMFRGVATNTFIDENGYIFANTKSGPEPVGNYFIEFYVHPETGILCHTKPKKGYNYNKDQSNPNMAKTKNPNLFYYRIAGIWYEITCRQPNKFEIKHQKFLSGEGDPDIVYVRCPLTGMNRATYKIYEINVNKIVDAIREDGKYKDYRTKFAYAPGYWNLYRLTEQMFGNPAFPLTKRQLNKKEKKALKLS